MMVFMFIAGFGLGVAVSIVGALSITQSTHRSLALPPPPQRRRSRLETVAFGEDGSQPLVPRR